MTSRATTASPDDERRRAVWMALSELFLDTRLDEADFERIARVLAASAFSDDELHGILEHEVAPVMGGNLFVAAGVWSGFDEAWVCRQAAARARRRRGFSVTAWLALRLIREDWRTLRGLTNMARRSSG